MIRALIVAIAGYVVATLSVPIEDQPRADVPRWPEFRGPRAQGVDPDSKKLPVHFGPSSRLAWQVELPFGHSCPCIWGDRIYVTGFDKGTQKLETICLDRQTGSVRWRQPAPTEKIETFFATHGPATPTPAADSERVYVYFGSYGILAYDFDGKEAWKKPLPTPTTQFGTGSSPVLIDGLLLLVYQARPASLLAIDPRSGATVWEKKNIRNGASYSVPLGWKGEEGPEVIVTGGRGVTAYSLKDGKERWWLGGLRGGGIPTPAVGEGMVFVVAHFPGGDPDDPMRLPPFDDLLKKYDVDRDGKLGEKEVPGDLVLYDRGGKKPEENITFSDMFAFIDKDKDGKIDRKEWTDAIAALAKMESSLVAIRPGPAGELPRDRIAWKEKRALPECPSPLYYQGRLYLVKDGGIASCLDAKTGKLVYRQRLGAGGFYYASPVAGDGKVYAASHEGVVVVYQVGDALRVLARNDLGERIVATPAAVDGKLYVRTEKHLYAFAGE
jgi:outer membrane protein assembly factor BamB